MYRDITPITMGEILYTTLIMVRGGPLLAASSRYWQLLAVASRCWPLLPPPQVLTQRAFAYVLGNLHPTPHTLHPGTDRYCPPPRC